MDGSSAERHDFWRSGQWWRRAGQTSLGVWGSNLLSLLGTVIAARVLGPEEYGSVILAMGVTALVGTFLDVTLEEATVFNGNRAAVSGDYGGLRALVKTSLRLDIVIGILVAAAIIALAEPLADVVSGGRLDPTLVRIAALALLVQTADSTASAALLIARVVHVRAWAMTATSLFRVLGVIVAVQLGGAEAMVISYVVGGAVGSVLLGFLAWRFAWRKWPPGPGPSKRPVGIGKLLRFGFHSSVTTSVYALYGSLVPVLLGATAGPAAVGSFAVAMLPVTVANTLTGPIRLAMFPEQSRLVAEGRVQELRRSVQGYTIIGFAVGILGAIVGWILMPTLIPLLFSSRFDAAVLPARILLIAAVFYFALAWGKTFPAAVGRPQVRTALATVELVVVASLLAFLGDQGSEGGAIAVSAGSAAVGVAWLILAPKLLRSVAEMQRSP